MEQISPKTKILEIALSLFSSKGYDAVGVQEIVNSAGITKPTLYYYFESKQGLLNALIQTKGQELVEKIKQSVTYNGDFFGTLTQTLKTLLNFANENPKYFRFHCSALNSPEDSSVFELYKPIKTELSQIILTLFKNATNQFGNMKGKEILYSTLFLNNATAIAMTSCSENKNIDEETLNSIIHSFIYGFAD